MWFDRSFEKARVNNGQYTNSKLHIRKKEARKAEYILNVGRCCKDSLKPDITKKKKKSQELQHILPSCKKQWKAYLILI